MKLQQHQQRHIEAWQSSGMSQAAYCREQRLNVKTFGNWLRAYRNGCVVNPNIARTQDSRLIFLNFDVELWNSISFVPTRLRTRQISQRIGQKTGIM
ncbi:MAG: hypothetical protein CV087_09155, partial [Candidatus Brocadia sp. WS118]